MTTKRPSQWAALAVWIVGCEVVGIIGGVATDSGSSSWFQGLVKPTWNPPGWVFAPVWTILYALMGVAAWLVWKRGGWARQARPLTIFLFQLSLNFAWSFIFFGAHRVAWALVDIVALWIAIGVTLRTFAHVDRQAAWLMVPYLAWVSFATALNAAILALNSSS